jgi:hypothetical protein
MSRYRASRSTHLSLAASSSAQRAAEISKTFPSAAALTALLESEAPALSLAWAEATEAVDRLFRELQILGQISDETRRHLLCTQRHFPLPGDAASMAGVGWFRSLSDWLGSDPYL